jgi:hypothetical protein
MGEIEKGSGNGDGQNENDESGKTTEGESSHDGSLL